MFSHILSCDKGTYISSSRFARRLSAQEVSLSPFQSSLESGTHMSANTFGDIPRPLQITELCLAIMQEVEEPRDLVSMACTSRRFTGMCLRLLWESPDFNGSPLVSMSYLFRDNVKNQLRQGRDANIRIPSQDFHRFDYYASLIRTLTIWHHGQEEPFVSITGTFNCRWSSHLSKGHFCVFAACLPSNTST
ncbi:hypothetical protein CALVIDRAFT_423334 [Calocera viscosa TUFC12733]|uniref:F-box domain-containing protein n=1 Tax=Calocera viscosa (strain TUFC12733) TaxID=1330018 RepID=A0A167PJ12_CALVF|nr:hypothetical protein CALVIDRAFT_423334 [Calocera viscosa TUFC12733]